MCSVFQGDPDFRFPEIFSRPFQSAASFFLQIFIFSSGTLFLRQSPTSILSQLALKSFENNWSTSDFMHSKWALSKRFSWPLHCMFFLFKLMLMLLKMIIFSQPPLAWHLFSDIPHFAHDKAKFLPISNDIFFDIFSSNHVLQYIQSLAGMSCTIMRELDQTGFLCLWSAFLFWLCEHDIKIRPYPNYLNKLPAK